jgi:pyruvate/2-oxoglutarate dehydrogenase complex dihydrolipoamide dehydrogenase (E3) component
MGGYVAAIAVQLGKKVAVVENRTLGGPASAGDDPTKALLEHAHALKVIRNAREWGVTMPAGTPSIDMSQVQTRKIGSHWTDEGIEFFSRSTRSTGSRARRDLEGPDRSLRGDKQTLEAGNHFHRVCRTQCSRH